jgi:hypothetical protein
MIPNPTNRSSSPGGQHRVGQHGRNGVSWGMLFRHALMVLRSAV